MARSFYNTGEAKGFTKANFYQAVLDLANGEEVEDNIVELIAKGAEYELEGLELAKAASAAKSGNGEKKDKLQSDYCVALRKAIVPLLNGTPKTAKQLLAEAEANGTNLSPTGKPWVESWLVQVLNAEAGVTNTKVIVETVNNKGLKAEKSANAWNI